MLNTIDNDLIDALAETMETLAFLSLGPTEDRTAPVDAVLCTIPFPMAYLPFPMATILQTADHGTDAIDRRLWFRQRMLTTGAS